MTRAVIDTSISTDGRDEGKIDEEEEENKECCLLGYLYKKEKKNRKNVSSHDFSSFVLFYLHVDRELVKFMKLRQFSESLSFCCECILRIPVCLLFQ